MNRLSISLLGKLLVRTSLLAFAFIATFAASASGQHGHKPKSEVSVRINPVASKVAYVEAPYLTSEVSLENMIEYPAEAHAKHIEGKVSLKVLIDSTGRAIKSDITSSEDTMLNAEARRVIAAARFFPAMDGERPVKMFVTQSITFNIASNDSAVAALGADDAYTLSSFPHILGMTLDSARGFLRTIGDVSETTAWDTTECSVIGDHANEAHAIAVRGSIVSMTISYRNLLPDEFEHFAIAARKQELWRYRTHRPSFYDPALHIEPYAPSHAVTVTW